MRSALRLPTKVTPEAANEDDPREAMDGNVTDLASRHALPTVAKGKKGSDTATMLAGVAIVAVLGAAAFWSMDTARTASDEVAPAPQQEVAAAPAAAETVKAEEPSAAPQQAAVARPDPAPQPILSRAPQPQPGAVLNPYGSPTVIFDGTSLTQSGAAPGVAGEAAPAQRAAGSDGSAGDFASRIGGVGGGTATAVATFDPATTVTQGTLIPAVLETAIDTDVPGFVRAVVSQDVRSYDGTRVLVPRSSRLIGQYQSGLQQGQKRAYVIWTRLIRPDGVSVDLASPATDFSGKGGLPGKVDSHFFERFGSAMLLSVIGGISSIATGGASVILGGGGGAAGAALQQNGNIGPTVRVRQGEPVRVFTARDLDFGRVAR